jgi:transcriptional regulator with XRE-family HTH domain
MNADDQRIVAGAWRSVGMLLRRARQNQGLKAREVAESCEMSESVLCRIELGRRESSLSNAFLMCMKLGVRLSEIMRIVEDEAFPISLKPWVNEPEKLLRTTDSEWCAVDKIVSEGMNPGKQILPIGLPELQDDDDSLALVACPHVDTDDSVELRNRLLVNVLRCTGCGREVERKDRRESIESEPR